MQNIILSPSHTLMHAHTLSAAPSCTTVDINNHYNCAIIQHKTVMIIFINHPLSASSIYYDTQHSLCSIYVPDSLFPQSLSKFSLVYLFLAPLTSYSISSPNHCLLFAAHAHTIATCFAVVPRLCHISLVSLSTL